MRLSRATLGAARIPGPGFDPAALRPGIVHLGVGAFHRAHQALLTQRALRAEWGDWGIVGVSLRSPAIPAALAAQDGLYTVLERDGTGTRAEIVGTLGPVLFAPDDPGAVIRAIATSRIVTLTITEKGYCLHAGRLDPRHPDIVHDRAAPDRPRSAIGLLAAGLAAVRTAGQAPPAVLSCDNLAGNGRALRQAVLDLAADRTDGLSAWIAGAVQFPCTMVDRIVPATADTDRAEAAALLGLEDAVTVVTEPFLQWEIEAFDGPRPRWDAAGAHSVPDVGPWETTKLRMLNGAHSAMAYLGCPRGIGTVAEAMRDAELVRFLRAMMLDEVAPTLPPGAPDAAAYADALIARWRNPAVHHRLQQIAMDGSVKLPQRLLGTLRDNRAAGRPSPGILQAVAAWIRFASGRDHAGAPTVVQDPLAAEMAAIRARAGDDPAALVRGFLTLTTVFGPGAIADDALARELVQALPLT